MIQLWLTTWVKKEHFKCFAISVHTEQWLSVGLVNVRDITQSYHNLTPSNWD